MKFLYILGNEIRWIMKLGYIECLLVVWLILGIKNDIGNESLIGWISKRM